MLPLSVAISCLLVLCLEVGPSDIFPFSVSMSLDMAIVPVLFVQPLLRESVSQ